MHHNLLNLSRKFLKKIGITMALVLLLLGLNGFLPQPSDASISQQTEAPGQLLIQSRQSIRDNREQTWQVVLFKRIKNDLVDSIDLRLVGYPEQTQFLHPASLSIALKDQTILLAPDQFAQGAPAPNVGQFNLKEILPQLPSDQNIQLILPLQETASTSTTLTIPLAVLLEWQFIL